LKQSISVEYFKTEEISVIIKKVFVNDMLLENRFPNLDGFNGTPNSEE
tara:strand:+ start:1038 stop:1181 length:144 start_codon:yes stop_codon:yes gene_type:complete